MAQQPKKTAGARKRSGGRTTPKKQVASGVTPVSEWKKSSGELFHEVHLPSGKVCLARRPGLAAFFEAGIIPNSLMGVLLEAMEGKGVPEKRLNRELKLILGDRAKMAEMLRMTDDVVIHCVVNPSVRSDHWTQEDVVAGLCSSEELGQLVLPDRRDPDLLYVDEVDDEDKQFIYNWAVGGTSDLESFRDQKASVLASVLDGEDVGSSA